MATDGTNQSHNIIEIHNVYLYQYTNFLNALALLEQRSKIARDFGSRSFEDAALARQSETSPPSCNTIR